MYTPKEIFLTKGDGRHREKLTSFEMALRDAGIAHLNLVRVSSIFPPQCRLIKREKGLQKLYPGQVVHCVLSDNATCEPHRLIGASIGVAIPRDPKSYGYISEHHSFGQRGPVAGDYAEDLAASMLATILGVQFDPDASWDQKKEVWKIAGKVIRSTNIHQTAVGHKTGLWTTVIAAAIFIPD